MFINGTEHFISEDFHSVTDIAPYKSSTLFNFTEVMEKLNFGYSLKNTPTLNERAYKLKLIEKIELLMKNMPWKAIFFTNCNRKPSNNTAEARFCLKSNQCPLQVKELMAFENDLI